MKYIDTHAHIYDPIFDEDRHEMIRRSVEAGVETILLPDVDSRTRPAMLSLCKEFAEVCHPMIGIHPTSINELPESWHSEIEMIHRELSTNRSQYIAIGEIGMDLYWSKDFEAQQREAFEAQLEISLEHSLPVSIHVRDAWQQTIEILSAYKGRGLRGVIHAFSGEIDDYTTVKSFGDFLFAVGGVVTFKKAKLADVIRQIPIEDLLLETDAPYLTPTPYRGKRNEPAYIPIIGEFIAQLKNITPQEVAKITTSNAVRMFQL